MNLFEKIQTAESALKALNPVERRILFDRLLKDKSIDFIELTAAYVRWLEDERRREEHMRGALILHLSVTSANEKNVCARSARKYLWENRWMEGSEFGHALIEEFGPVPERNNAM